MCSGEPGTDRGTCRDFQATRERAEALVTVKVKESRNKPGVAQRVPGGLGFQMFMPFDTWRWWSRQPDAPASFTPRNVPGTHFH